MKFNIPEPCFEKLSKENFCSKCKHHIQDFSNLNQKEIQAEIEENFIKCGIFTKRQVDGSNHFRSIFNVVAFTALGIITTNAQEIDNVEDQQVSGIVKNQIKFKLTDENLIDNDENFRLLINDQLILEQLELNKEYTISFEAERGSEIFIRIASNKSRLETERLLHNYNFPEVIQISRSELKVKSLIMGKLIYRPNVNNKL